MGIAQELHLDVARAQDHLFQIALAIAKGGLGLAPPLAHLGLQLALAHDRAHPAPAAAPAGLEHQGITDRLGLGPNGGEILAQHLGCRDHRHTGRNRHPPRAGLVAKRAHRFRLRADEGDAGCGASLDEFGVFRQQPISGVDRVGPRHLRHPDDFRDRQIGPDGREPFADPIGLVCLETVQAQLVFLGKDRDGLLAQLVRGPHDADGDLAPVGDKDLAELGHGASSTRFVWAGTLAMPRCSAR